MFFTEHIVIIYQLESMDHFNCPFSKTYIILENKTNHPISSNIHPSATANKAIHSLKIGGGGLKNKREHHIILTKYEAVHPKAVSELIPHQGC